MYKTSLKFKDSNISKVYQKVLKISLLSQSLKYEKKVSGNTLQYILILSVHRNA